MYNVDTHSVENLRFLRMNFIDSYNNTMGNVDLADQLRGSYRPDIWLRNRKWWWSIMFWSIGVMLTNAYIVYVKVNEEHGVKKSKLLSQHDFREMIATYWINPEYYEQSTKGMKTYVTKKQTESERKRKRGFESQSSLSTITTNFQEDHRATRVTDNSLDPLMGQLKCRLAHDRDHFPIPKASANVKCSLHRWGNNTMLRKEILLCPTCKVHLCTECYRVFHMEPYVVERKKELFKPLDQPNTT